MKELSAVGLRNSLARVAAELERTQEPILLRIGKAPAGVLISLKQFRERFVMSAAAEERKRLVQDILDSRIVVSESTEDTLDSLRDVSHVPT